MPGMDGLEISRRLRKNGSNNPPYVILLTARSEKGDIVKGLGAGANDFVAKPYNTEELRARISVGQRMLEMQSHLLKARNDLAHQATHDFLS
jgi:DNA-binding response OmpR family regulator